MDGKKLVKMANEIAAFFAAEPERRVALQGIATHLKKFWEPRMREEIRRHVSRGGEGMSSIAIQAVKKLA